MANGKREKLVEASDRLFSRQGFERSSIALIAEAAEVPAGNVYYYFKSKEEIAAAVVKQRNEALARLFARIDGEPAPRRRLQLFLADLEAVRAERARHGCPIGSFCQEANRSGPALASLAATSLARVLDWLQLQFQALGFGAEAARAHAVHVAAALQGAMLLAQTFGDPGIIRSETRRLRIWLEGLPASPAAGSRAEAL